MRNTGDRSRVRTSYHSFALAAVTAAAPVAGHAAAVGGVTIESVSSEWNGAPDLRAVNVLKGPGTTPAAG